MLLLEDEEGEAAAMGPMLDGLLDDKDDDVCSCGFIAVDGVLVAALGLLLLLL